MRFIWLLGWVLGGLLSPLGAIAKEPAVSTPQDDFAQARAHFARAHRVALAKVVPADLAHQDAALKDLQVGDLIAFVHPRRRGEVRGFASPDGQVVRAKDSASWGALFRAARVHEPPHALDAPGLARRLVWLTQQGDLVLDPGPALNDFSVAPGASSWPIIKRDPRGATLIYSYRARTRRQIAHPWRVRVHVAPDYQVSLR